MRITDRRGIALLSVLWLTAALTAIAFTVANQVRAETDRTLTQKEALRASYLAAGAIDRALLYIQWGPQYVNPDGSAKYYRPPTPRFQFDFPSGVATVEVIPENSKLNVNTATVLELQSLVLALGTDSARAASIAAAILDWRTPTPGGSFSQLDQQYLTAGPSFRSRHASFQEIEELMVVQGVTPDLFYGSYSRGDDGRLVPHAGLRDCLSVYGAMGPLDVNTVEPAVMQAIGIPPDIANALVTLRKAAPIRAMDQLTPFLGSGAGVARLGLITNSVLTLRATARLKLANHQLSEVRRSAAAMVKFLPQQQTDPPFHILRWYDDAPVLQ